MRPIALAAILACALPRPAAAAGSGGLSQDDYRGWRYPDFVVLSVLPRNMWAANPRLPAPGGARIRLTYQFLDGPLGRRRISACPDPALFSDARRAPACERFHEAAVAALRRWADASGHLELARAGEGERANVYIGFTELEGPGLVVFNSSDPEHRDAGGDDSPRGFERAHFPAMRVNYATLFINSRLCMFVDDRSQCPPDTRTGAGKTLVGGYPFRSVALHEAGHVMGLAHFFPSQPTIMDHPGTRSAFTDLEDADRRAVRDFYDRAAAGEAPRGGSRPR